MRHPQNVPGDFYIELECCTACGVMHEEAPDLLGWDRFHCFVQRQPEDDEAISRAITAMTGMELGCLRYAGSDNAIRQRIVDIGEGDCLDRPLITIPRGRNRVTFTANDHAMTAEGVAQILQEQVATIGPNWSATVQRKGKGAVLGYYWGYGTHRAVITRRDEEWHARIHPATSMASVGARRTFHNVLTHAERFSNIAWHADGNWRDVLSTPY